jgi:hypothetical protein
MGAVMTAPQHLDVYEVAEALDCCAATVRREANRGRMVRPPQHCPRVM